MHNWWEAFIFAWKNERYTIIKKVMNKLTINIEVPAGMSIDMDRLKMATNDFVRQYVSQIYICNLKHDVASGTHKSTEPFRRLRGILSSDKPYKEMLEDALREKYSI